METIDIECDIDCFGKLLQNAFFQKNTLKLFIFYVIINDFIRKINNKNSARKIFVGKLMMSIKSNDIYVFLAEIKINYRLLINNNYN